MLSSDSLKVKEIKPKPTPRAEKEAVCSVELSWPCQDLLH